LKIIWKKKEKISLLQFGFSLNKNSLQREKNRVKITYFIRQSKRFLSGLTQRGSSGWIKNKMFRLSLNLILWLLSDPDLYFYWPQNYGEYFNFSQGLFDFILNFSIKKTLSEWHQSFVLILACFERQKRELIFFLCGLLNI